MDTNILVRLLVNDDEKQVAKIKKTIKSEIDQNKSFLITNLVILETIWVLESCYKASREQIIEALEKVFTMMHFRFECMEELQLFLNEALQTSADLDDILIGLNTVRLGADKVITLDKKAGKLKQFECL